MSKISIATEDRVFVLTGAGISAESGLPTFRASDGLWAGNRIEDVCTPEAWERNPWRVWEFYSARREAGAKAQPNPAHVALAELERRLGERFFLCTQNVDDLHERAGSRRLLAYARRVVQGALRKTIAAGAPVEDRAIYRSLDEVGRCPCGGRLRRTSSSSARCRWRWIRIQEEIQKANAEWWCRHVRFGLSGGQLWSIGRG